MRIKKVLSVFLALIFLFSVVVSAGDIPDVTEKWKNTIHVSCDSIKSTDGSIVCAGDLAKTNYYSAPSGITEVTFWGWITSDVDFVGFSYSINGGEKFTDPYFTVEPEQAVKDAGVGEYDSRFDVRAVVSEGTQLVRVYADYADGESEAIWACEVTVGESTDYEDSGFEYEDNDSENDDSFDGIVYVDVPNLPDATDFSAAGYTHDVLHIGANDSVSKSIGTWDLAGVSKIVISYGGDPTAPFDSHKIYVVDCNGNTLGNAQLSQSGEFWAFGQRTVEVEINTDYCGEVFITKDEPHHQIAIDAVTLIHTKITDIEYGTCGDNLTWTLDDEGTLTISGTGDMENYSSITEIPWYNYLFDVKMVIIENGVTSIGNNVFNECSNLVSVTIPDSITSIGESTFEWCYNLTSVTIPDSVTSIGNYAFYYCFRLTSVTIGYSVTSIGDYAFYDCSNLTSVVIPDSVTNIGAYAFYSCSLTSVTIPNGVTDIGDSAFAWCESLTSVTIPDSVISIGNEAFYYCKSLTSVTIPDSVTSIGTGVFQECKSLTSVTIPDSVTYIGNSAFQGCSSFTSVTIPDSVTSIGDDAFRSCSSLTSITIPDSVTSIGDNAFDACSSLTSITVDENNKYYSNDEYGVLFNKNKTELIQYPIGNERISYTIPDSVTSIGDSAFYRCSSLTSVTIPDSVTSIGVGAFYGCSSLTSVTIPDSVTSIGGYAFVYCSSLTSVTIPDSVTSIGDYAFAICSSLTSATIGDSVTIIGEGIFSGSSNLISVTIPDGITSIGVYAFHNCSSLASITIPDSVTSIGDSAFGDCSSLTSVIIPDSVTSIGDYAFAWCESLTSVTMGDGVTSIGYHAFLDSYNLTSITVDENNEYYSSDEYGVLFNKDKTTLIQYPIGNARTSYVIPYSVTNIGDRAFDGCSSLTSITIPDSVISIGDEAFRGCYSLTSVTIGDGVTSIGNNVFLNCYSLTSVTIGNSVTNIVEGAFRNCSSLTSVTIPDSVTSIGEYAFRGCSSLNDVYYTGTEEEWNQIDIGYYNDSLLNATIHFNAFVPKAPELAEGSGYVVDEAVGAVVAKPSAKGGESLDAFMSNIATDPEYVRVVDADGNVQTSVTKLITGYKVQLLGPDGSAVKEYDIVILGDTDRNGRFTISDVSGVQSAVAAKPDKNTVEFLEANIDGNARLSVTDASALQSFLAKGTW